MITRALLAALGICIAALIAQTFRLGAAQDALAAHQAAVSRAVDQSKLRGATTAQEAVSSYVQAQERDAPTVQHVADRVRNVCVRDEARRDLPVPAAAGGAGQASRQAQDDADRAAFLGAVAEDLKTCQSELNRLDAIRRFHNDNVGAGR